MKKMFVPIILLSSFSFLAQAAFFKCQQGNGRYLFSDKPCDVVSTLPKDTIMTTSTGRVAKLSISESPIPMPSEIVENLFSRIEIACQTKDGEALLSQFSSKVQKIYLSNKVKRQSLFDLLSNNCEIFEKTRSEIKKSPAPIMYATKKPSKDIWLCFYTAKQGLENCKGNIKVTIEDNKFKLDAPY